MAKFKTFFYPSADRSNKKLIGTYKSKAVAANNAYDFASNEGYLASCDVKKDVVEALMTRDYYMMAYGPRELEIEEVVS